MSSETPTRGVQRVRHPLKLRRAEVLRTQHVTPHLLCVTLGGDDLADFVSGAHDDHVKLFFPAPGQNEPVLPPPPVDGAPPAPPAEGAPRPVMRDYTPRRYDPVGRTLDIEFVLHGDGPAATWAAQARPGQQLGIGGPRGSFVVPDDYDWYLLVGDDTALPAIARRLEELPSRAVVQVVAEVEDGASRPPLAAGSGTTVAWVERRGAEPGSAEGLLAELQQLRRPAGEGYVWAAGEAGAIAAVRRYLVEAWQIDKGHIRAAAYWKRGTAAHHQNLEG